MKIRSTAGAARARSLGIGLASTMVLFTASQASAQVTHHRTSRDSFLRNVQFGTKAELIAGLRNRPAVLKAMSQALQCSEDDLVNYIQNNVGFGHLDHSGEYS